MKQSHETKTELRARINELQSIIQQIREEDGYQSISALLKDRIEQLSADEANAVQDIRSSVLDSHKAICSAKNMSEKEAYGNNPTLYYTLAIAGECGEMANSIVKNCRNGYNEESVINSIKSELPDVVIYSYILAYVMDIDLASLVAEKCQTVVKRAESGYYGGPLR